jgi:hypothetical protein
VRRCGYELDLRGVLGVSEDELPCLALARLGFDWTRLDSTWLDLTWTNLDCGCSLTYGRYVGSGRWLLIGPGLEAGLV